MWGCMVVADQGRGCAIERGQTTLSLFSSLCQFWTRLFLPGTAVCLQLVSSAPLPELCSLAVILLMGFLLWAPLCGYKLTHLPLPNCQEEVIKRLRVRVFLGFLLALPQFLPVVQLMPQLVPEQLPQDMCKESVLVKMSAFCSRLFAFIHLTQVCSLI